MKTWLRNLALGALIAAPGGWYANKEYQNYRYPDLVSIDFLKDGTSVGIYRAKSNTFFEPIDTILGIDRNHSQTRVVSLAGFEDKVIDLYATRSEKKGKEISKNWKKYEENAKRPKGHKSFNASDYLAYRFLENVNESERAIKYSIEMFEADKIHEFNHAEMLNRKTKYSKEKLEAIAMLASMEKYPLLALSEAIRSYKENTPIYKDASFMILSELIKYPDTPNVYSLCHDSDLSNKLPKRAKELKSKLLEK